ncbi:hypothetical protein NA57DRAFT_68106 [Rhizodiscina lignyota]|uniref:Uncharacterized protein n=1 Tax=Rhizodiscina lignyota TaxID=1504668 RepID=A0A9P4I905_9PEZI|nr:hypothetical protein NA57DRAFT_68106 [Rhizodiscina lignyota]
MHSFNYLLPALFWNVSQPTYEDLGNLSTGGSLGLGQVTTATLRSEPGFQPSFTATFLHGEDYLTIDPSDGISRPGLSGIVIPDDGSVPFQMQASGIQYPDATLASIVATNKTKGLAIPYGAVYSGKKKMWVPTFRGGSEKYANLQNSIFVASETVSDSPNANEFYVGMKISKVFATNTSVVIGDEFP